MSSSKGTSASKMMIINSLTTKVPLWLGLLLLPVPFLLNTVWPNPHDCQINLRNNTTPKHAAAWSLSNHTHNNSSSDSNSSALVEETTATSNHTSSDNNSSSALSETTTTTTTTTTSNHNSSSSTPDDNTPQPIPAKIHLIYLSPGLPQDEQPSFPKEVQDHVQGWKDLHPTWEVKVWNNSAVHEEFPTLIPFLEVLQPMAWVADLLRYFIIHRHGGFYFDTDIMPFQSIEAFRHNNLTAWGVCERPSSGNASVHQDRSPLSSLILPTDTCKLLCNAIIAAVPNHPALQATATEAFRRTSRGVVKERQTRFSPVWTGPAMWTEKVKEHNVTIFQAGTFFPCDYTQTARCVAERYVDINKNVYGMHKWSKSWH